MSKSIDLASRRTWIFEADVLGYYIPEKPLIIEDFELRVIKDKERGDRYRAFLTVKANYYNAEKIAREKFERIFNALTLTTGRRFDYELLDKVDDIIDKVNACEYHTAICKLEKDIKDRIEKWISDPYGTDLIEKVDAIISAQKKGDLVG